MTHHTSCLGPADGQCELKIMRNMGDHYLDMGGGGGVTTTQLSLWTFKHRDDLVLFSTIQTPSAPRSLFRIKILRSTLRLIFLIIDLVAAINLLITRHNQHVVNVTIIVLHTISFHCPDICFQPLIDG